MNQSLGNVNEVTVTEGRFSHSEFITAKHLTEQHIETKNPSEDRDHNSINEQEPQHPEVCQEEVLAQPQIQEQSTSNDQLDSSGLGVNPLSPILIEERLQGVAKQAEEEWSVQRSRRRRKDVLELRHLHQENIISDGTLSEASKASLPRLTRAGKSLHHD